MTRRELRERRQEAAAQGFLARIEQSAQIPAGATSQQVVSAVTCPLLLRVEAGEARDFFESMPETVRAALTPCVHHRPERAQVFDRQEYLRRVAEHLNIGPNEADDLARVVFAAMREWLPRNQSDDVASQLPPDLRDLWGDPAERAS